MDRQPRKAPRVPFSEERSTEPPPDRASDFVRQEQDALLCLAECELRPLEDVAAYCHSNLLKARMLKTSLCRKMPKETFMFFQNSDLSVGKVASNVGS